MKVSVGQAGVMLAVMAFASTSGNARAESGSWPCWRGPDGSGSLSSGLQLVDDLGKAKLLWESDVKDIPSSYSVIMGGAAGPVVANGRVFLNYCTPGGTAVAEGYYKALVGEKTPQSIVENFKQRKSGYALHIKTVEDIRRRCLIGADDVILCLDAQTGKTLWKAVFADAGINPSFQVRGWPSAKRGPHCLAAVAYGKVVGIGSAGLVHCVDEADGKPAWEFKLSCYEKNMAAKKTAIQSKGIPNLADPRLSPSFAGGVFVIPDSGKAFGLDPATGAKLWEVACRDQGPCAPVRWVHEGHEYIIARDKCIEPKTGKVLWEIPGAQHGGGTVAVGEGYLVFTGNAGRRDEDGVGFSAYKITPQGATKAWQLEGKYHGIGSCSPVILKGHVYCKIPCEGTEGFVCIELATGKVAAEAKSHSDSCGSAIGADGRVFYNGCWIDADPKSFKYLPALRGKGCPPEREMGDDQSYALSASSTPCIVDGRLYVRGQRSVLCFDLREQPAH